MDRRLLGVITLTGVLVAVALLSSAGQRRVAGSAQPAPPIASPTVGDCLLQPLPSAMAAGAGSPEVALSEVSLGTCSGAVFGQLVALLPGRSTGAAASVPPPVDCTGLRQDGSVSPDAPLKLGCFVRATGNSELTGTVIGLGDAPVPLTG